MENKKMTMALFSGSIDKLTGAGVVLSGAAADDMDVDIFVLLMGARGVGHGLQVPFLCRWLRLSARKYLLCRCFQSSCRYSA